MQTSCYVHVDKSDLQQWQNHCENDSFLQQNYEPFHFLKYTLTKLFKTNMQKLTELLHSAFFTCIKDSLMYKTR